MSGNNILELMLNIMPCDVVEEDFFSTTSTLAVVSKTIRSRVEDMWSQLSNNLSKFQVDRFCKDNENDKFVSFTFAKKLGLTTSDMQFLQSHPLNHTRRIRYTEKSVLFTSACKAGGLHLLQRSILFEKQKRLCRKISKSRLQSERTEKSLRAIAEMCESYPVLFGFKNFIIRDFVLNGKGGIKRVIMRCDKLLSFLSILRENVSKCIDDDVFNSCLVRRNLYWLDLFLRPNVTLLGELHALQRCIDFFEDPMFRNNF